MAILITGYFQRNGDPSKYFGGIRLGNHYFKYSLEVVGRSETARGPGSSLEIRLDVDFSIRKRSKEIEMPSEAKEILGRELFDEVTRQVIRDFSPSLNSQPSIPITLTALSSPREGERRQFKMILNGDGDYSALEKFIRNYGLKR